MAQGYYRDILFLDETGTTYSIGNDSTEYVFWFDGKTSTNLFNIKKIFLLSNRPELNVSVEQGQEKIRIIDSDHIKVDDTDPFVLGENIVAGYEFRFTGKPIGTQFNDRQTYIYCLYFIAHLDNSDESNQIYQVYFDIDDHNESRMATFTHRFNIACEFVGVDETLKINLQNMGVRIPDKVSEALATTDPHEIFPDERLLNLKFKELLTEYMNIIGNMGSYDSLINSLKWFGYDDNLRIYEFWKNAVSKRYDISDIERKLYTELNDYIKYNQKSTYIGLFYLLNTLKRDDRGMVMYGDGDGVDGDDDTATREQDWKWHGYPGMEYVESELLEITKKYPRWNDFDKQEGVLSDTNGQDAYFWHDFTQDPQKSNQALEEPNPIMTDVIWDYSAYDLYLKMCLLSYYYQKYFLPIHIDLYDIMASKGIFYNFKFVNRAESNLEDRVNNMGEGKIFYKDTPSKYWLNECTAWVNQSNKWNTFKNYEAEYIGPIYEAAKENGGVFEMFNMNTVEVKTPNVFIASPDPKEANIPSTDGLEGFYITTDGGVKVPIEFEYLDPDAAYQSYEMYVYYSRDYNRDWPIDWNMTEDELEELGFNRYYFAKPTVENVHEPVSETVWLFVNRQGHYLVQSVFTALNGAKTVLNKEFDVAPDKIDFKLYKLVPRNNAADTAGISVFEGLNYVTKKPLRNKISGENYVGYYENGEPVKGSWTFDFENKDYYNDALTEKEEYNKYASKLFFFSAPEDKSDCGILLTNHIVFIKLHEVYGERIELNGKPAFIDYPSYTLFYGQDRELRLNGMQFLSLAQLEREFPDYIWMLKEADDSFEATNDKWTTVLVGLRKEFGYGTISAERMEAELTGKFEWYSQNRFVIDMYTTEELDNNSKINLYTLVYLKPEVFDTYQAVGKNGRALPKWVIEPESIIYNSNKRQYEKQQLREKSRNTYMFSPYNEIYHFNAEPGYYTIKHQYRFTPDGDNMTIIKKNALCVEKSTKSNL